MTRSANTPSFLIFIMASRRTGTRPTGSDPQGEFRGKNISIERHSFAETAKHFGKSEDEMSTTR